jgi:hypothetical protein
MDSDMTQALKDNKHTSSKQPQAASKGGVNAEKPKGGHYEAKNARHPGKKTDKPHGKHVSAPKLTPKMIERRVKVDGQSGVSIYKIATVDQNEFKEVKVAYSVEFVGHAPISFERLGEARERSKGEPPEATATVVEDASVVDNAEDVQASA